MQFTKSLSPRTLLISITGSLLALGLLVTPLTQAQSSGRDCDSNAVLRCGAYSTGELKQKYNSESSAQNIFRHFGISSTEINRLGDTAVNGHVTKGGRVLVDGKTVATGAKTAGRQDMPGSTKITRNGEVFYKRPPSVSFNQSKLDAYVVMKNGQFQYAIIKSCGNPVEAKPVKVEKPAPPPVKPQVTPPKPVPSAAECRLINVSTKEQRKVSVTVTSSTTNAQVTGYTIDFGDGTAARTVSAAAGNENSGENTSDSGDSDDVDNSSDTTVNTTSTNSSGSGGSTTSGNSTTSNSSSTNMTTDTSVNNSTSTDTETTNTSPEVTHQYAQDGTYTITASVQVRHADGRTETKTSQTCQQPVTFATPVTPAGKTEPPAPPPPAPPQPQVLPDTGVGAIAGISAAIGLASTFGYALYGWLRGRFGLV